MFNKIRREGRKWIKIFNLKTLSDLTLMPTKWRWSHRCSLWYDGVCLFQTDRGNSEALKPQQQKNSSSSSSDQKSEDDFVSPPRIRIKLSADKRRLSDARRPSVASATPTLSMTSPVRRASLAISLGSDPGEKERQKWRAFREKKTSSRSAVLQLRQKRCKQSPTEPSEYDSTSGCQDHCLQLQVLCSYS